MQRQGELILITDVRELSYVFELPEAVRDIGSWNENLSRFVRFGGLQLAAALRLIAGIKEDRSADYSDVKLRKTRGLLPITFIQNGWFQNFRSADAVAEGLPSLRKSLDKAAREWLAIRSVASLPTYFCHLRRTDYATHLDGVTLPLRYYQEAIRRLRPDPSTALLLIASDDIEFARLAFADLENVRFVEEGPELTFAILRLCDAGVISNSTFAWWVGHSVAKRGGRVLAPKNFLGWRTGCETPPGIQTPLFEWIEVNRVGGQP